MHHTCLWNDSQAGGVCGDEAEEKGVHVDLHWGDGPHHAQVVHHEKPVTWQSIQAMAWEATRCQQVTVYVEIRQASRERVKLVLHFKCA